MMETIFRALSGRLGHTLSEILIDFVFKRFIAVLLLFFSQKDLNLNQKYLNFMILYNFHKFRYFYAISIDF